MEGLVGHVGRVNRALDCCVRLTDSVIAVGPDRWSWEIPAGWRQGRGAWGGIVIAGATHVGELVARALNDGAEPQVVRSVNGVMVAPLIAGPAILATRVVRAGSSVVTVSVEISNVGADQPAAIASVVIGSPRATTHEVEGPLWREPAPAEVAAVLNAGVPDVPDADFGDLAPEFFGQLATKPLTGFPGQRDARAPTLGWLRLKDAPDRGDAAWLAALTDAWWTIAIVGTDGTRPVATTSFQADLIVNAADLDPTGYLLHVGRAQGARDGYVAETRELWTREGALAARNNQVVAIIK